MWECVDPMASTVYPSTLQPSFVPDVNWTGVLFSFTPNDEFDWPT